MQAGQLSRYLFTLVSFGLTLAGCIRNRVTYSCRYPSSHISLNLDTSAVVGAEVFDFDGHLVQSIPADTFPAGVSVIEVLSVDNAGKPLKAGNYLYHLTYPDSVNPSAMYSIFLDGRTARPDSTNRYPNPFSPLPQIHFTLDTTISGTVELYNVAGKLIFALPVRLYEPGEHTIPIDGSEFDKAGVYFWVLKSGDEVIFKGKVVLLK